MMDCELGSIMALTIMALDPMVDKVDGRVDP